MTATITPVCPKCTPIKKSGIKSCCGRGGSWFQNCGTTDNIKLEHTWYDGIQACKARGQSKATMGLQLKAAQQNIHGSSNNVDTVIYSKAGTTAANTFSNTSTPIPEITPIITSAKGSITLPSMRTSTNFMADPIQSPASMACSMVLQRSIATSPSGTFQA